MSFQYYPLQYKDLINLQQFNISNMPENYTMSYLIYQITIFPEYNFLCKHDNRIIAYILGKVEDDGTGHVASICVDLDYRMKGIAKKLLGMLMEKYKCIDRVSLKVRVSNKIAVSFYEKFGFQIEEESKEYYGDGENAYSMVYSRKRQE